MQGRHKGLTYFHQKDSFKELHLLHSEIYDSQTNLHRVTKLIPQIRQHNKTLLMADIASFTKRYPKADRRLVISVSHDLPKKYDEYKPLDFKQLLRLPEQQIFDMLRTDQGNSTLSVDTMIRKNVDEFIAFESQVRDFIDRTATILADMKQYLQHAITCKPGSIDNPHLCKGKRWQISLAKDTYEILYNITKNSTDEDILTALKHLTSLFYAHEFSYSSVSTLEKLERNYMETVLQQLDGLNFKKNEVLQKAMITL